MQSELGCIIPLSNGMIGLIDLEDLARVEKDRWYASHESNRTKWYAKRHAKKHEKDTWKTSKIRLHHFILDFHPAELPGKVIDHINGNGLDNRKSNLRIVDAYDNNHHVRRRNEEPCL